MKKILLGALLLGSPAALAGGYAPATVAPAPIRVVSAPVPAPLTVNIPALPLNAAPMRSTQASQASGMVTTPVAAARNFLLTAPSGTSVTLHSTTQIKMELEDVQVTGSAAEDMSAADIQDMKDMFAEMSGMDLPGSEVKISVGKVLASGARELITSTLSKMPAESGMEDFAINVIQTIEPDGHISATRVKSDNAEMQQMFDSMTEEMLSQMDSGSTTDVYGFPLTVGHSVTATDTVDMQALLGGMLTGMVQATADLPAEETADMQKMLNSLEAQPLNTTTVTTYKGLNSAGEHIFTQTGTAQPWSIKLGSDLPEKGGEPMTLNMTLSDLNVAGESAYRTDGLPSRLNMTQDMRMKMDMTTAGEKPGSLSMTMRMNISVQASAE